MVDGDCAPTGPNTHAHYDGAGHFECGIWARVDLMKNILDYFGVTPTGPGTDVSGGDSRNALSQAAPNPFNPATRIAFSVKEAGPVRIEVYNVSGRIVRTLLDAELEAGADGYVVWDGADDRGNQCASGVYFYRIEAPGFAASRKMVMLR
jgi:flagellar hook assembly protein FlgD